MALLGVLRYAAERRRGQPWRPGPRAALCCTWSDRTKAPQLLVAPFSRPPLPQPKARGAQSSKLKAQSALTWFNTPVGQKREVRKRGGCCRCGLPCMRLLKAKQKPRQLSGNIRGVGLGAERLYIIPLKQERRPSRPLFSLRAQPPAPPLPALAPSEPTG